MVKIIAEKKTSQPVKIYFDPVGNIMNIWWGNPSDAYETEEVESRDRNDVIVKDKHGKPISIEIIGVLPSELNISDQISRLGSHGNLPYILQG